MVFFSAWHARKIGARMEEFGVRIVTLAYYRNVFLGWICSNFMGDTFTINIDIVSE